MLFLDRPDLMQRTLLADLDALEERLQDRQAEQDPGTLAEASRIVRAAIGALGTSQTRLAAELGIAGDKTVRDWCAARRTPPRSALRAMRLMLERIVAPPPEELLFAQDRFAACGAALRPRLDELADRAEAAGWTRREVAAAVRAWVAAQPA